MPRRAPPPPSSLAVRLLREAACWSQQELAKVAGMSPAEYSQFETGYAKQRLTGELLYPLAEAMGFSREEADLALQAALALSRHPDTAQEESDEQVNELQGDPHARVEPAAGERRLARRHAARLCLALREPLERAMLARLRRRRISNARAAADALWNELARHQPEQRRLLVDVSARFRGWALCERLGAESERAAADSSAAAHDLATLALLVADRAPAAALWRTRGKATAWAFVGNALRVGCNLKEADAAFATARQLWQAGTDANPDLFPEWRLLDLEASLRRDQRRFPAALELLDRAQAAAPSGQAGHILLNQAFTLEQSGDAERALATLSKAAPHVARSGEPRDICVLAFNTVVNLCHLGRFEEAKTRLTDVNKLTSRLNNRLDQARVLWLSARLAEGLGNREEARSVYQQLQNEFKESANDTAMVSMELAILDLEDGRTAEVRELAPKVAWVFLSQEIERETLAALRLWWQAAAQDRADLDQARRLLARLAAGGRGLRTEGS
jgi:transcriptional regulator with XRE-family HTH domain